MGAVFAGALWPALIALVLLLGACTKPPALPATVPAPPTLNASLYELDADAIAARLTTVDSLLQAAKQLAGATAVPTGAVRVLMRTETCASCAQADGQSGALAELTVDQAVPLLSDGVGFWLSIPPLACLYTLDGTEIRPQGCRMP